MFGHLFNVKATFRTSIVLFAMAAIDACAATLHDLGSLPGAMDTTPSAVNTDGSVVVGRSGAAYMVRAFRWRQGGIMEDLMKDLGDLAGTTISSALGVSGDGQVVVGSKSNYHIGPSRAFRWKQGEGLEDLGVLTGATTSSAMGVSSDGNVVVGESFNGSTRRAFRWTRGEGMEDLGVLAGEETSEHSASAVSADGTVVVGSTFSISSLARRAFRWTRSQGMQNIGAIAPAGNPLAHAVNTDGSVVAPGGSYSLAYAVNNDGSVVVGESDVAGSFPRAFRWTQPGAMQDLGLLPNTLASRALGVSGDGAVVVGESYNQYSGASRAFRWTQSGDMQPLRDYFLSVGINVDGWDFQRALAISSDGSAIIGTGTYQGVMRAFAVTGLPKSSGSGGGSGNSGGGTGGVGLAPGSVQPSEAISSVKLMPAKRAVKAGKTAKLAVVVGNDSTTLQPVTIKFDSNDDSLIADPSPLVFDLPAKRSAKSRPRLTRRTFSFEVSEDYEGGKVTITATAGSRLSTCEVTVKPLKEPREEP